MTQINDVSGFMIDLDGTIYKGGQPIDGAKEFISFLKKDNIPFVFLTNNSSSSRSYYVEKLNKMGFSIALENVLTSTTATLRYIRTAYPDKTVYPLGTEQFVKEVKESKIVISDDPDIVLLAFDKTITYEKINDAYHHILNGAKLIATHPDDLCPTESGYDVDIGPFIRLFESMTGTKAEVIGKPNRKMIEMAALEMNADPAKLIMVGDRLYTDMRMAFDSGIRSILVYSGETRPEDLKDSDITVTYSVNSVADIEKMLK
jgi:Predicted sugar phosphatases of the HAD superfamily